MGKKQILPFLVIFLGCLQSQAENITGYPVQVQTYSIQKIPMQRCETTAANGEVAIVFAEYGSEAGVVYPAPKDKIPENIPQIIDVCRKTLKRNINYILKAQKENLSIEEYLTANNRISLFTKKDYLNLVEDAQEQTVQIDPQTGKTIAEFRSAQIPIDENTALSLYLTFIYVPKGEMVEKIIVSRVKLEGTAL